MKIIKANAEYTGGGIYRYTAQTDAGTWLVGDTLWDAIEEVDADPDETEESWYSEWMEEHAVKTYFSSPVDEYTDLMNELIRWILEHKPDGNYSPEEIERELQEALDDHDTEVRIEEYYSENGDITFIMRETFLRSEPIKSEVVGFYYGKPNAKDTEYYKDHGTVAYYR